MWQTAWQCSGRIKCIGFRVSFIESCRGLPCFLFDLDLFGLLGLCPILFLFSGISISLMRIVLAAGTGYLSSALWFFFMSVILFGIPNIFLSYFSRVFVSWLLLYRHAFIICLRFLCFFFFVYIFLYFNISGLLARAVEVHPAKEIPGYPPGIRLAELGESRLAAGISIPARVCNQYPFGYPRL